MIDIDKEYRTRDGREVRIYAIDGGRSKNIIHGATLEQDAGWCIAFWDRNGKWNTSGYNSDYELIEVKPRIQQTIYINIYDGYESISSTEKIAKDREDCGIRARVKVDIDVEEGHGL
jgi:hypothetical protein